jgi:UDP-N-acetylmuramyl pentapeptide synthase
MSIQKLIDQTYSYFVEAQGTDLADLYEDDLSDFQVVQTFLNMNDHEGACIKINDMDTEPREQIVLAMAADYGNKFVEYVMGYEVA